MWCGQCQADVPAEVSSDNQRVFCTICGALLSTVDSPPARPSTDRPASDKTKDARELLHRWSSGKGLDPFGPSFKKPDVAESLAPPVREPEIAAVKPTALPVALSEPPPIAVRAPRTVEPDESQRPNQPGGMPIASTPAAQPNPLAPALPVKVETPVTG